MSYRSLTLLFLVAVGGCTLAPESRPLPPPPEIVYSSPGAEETLESSTSPALSELAQQLAAVKASSSWTSRGYVSPAEHDALEVRFAAYLARRRQAISTAAKLYGSADVEQKRRGAVSHVRREQLEADTILVEALQDDAVAVRKLNEGFERSGIERGAFDRIRKDATSPAAIRFVREQLRRSSSQGAHPPSNASLAEFQGENDRLGVYRYQDLDRRISRLLADQFPFAPSLVNNLSRLGDATGAASLGRTVHDTWWHAASWSLGEVGRWKNPLCHPLPTTSEQRRQIREQLQPGDILLTYAAGYASNVLIRGKFKHAIIFVGSLAQRRQCGLAPELAGQVEGPAGVRLRDVLGRSHLADGREIDVIEALREGVIFNNLDHILKDRVNRMVVLRPVLSDAERRAALITAFSFVGDEYDFHFDFGDASDQVCTELVYRAYDGKGALRFPLLRRCGRPTLAADDIIRNYLAAPDAMELVLMLDRGGDGAAGSAEILHAAAANGRLSDVMRR